MTKNKTTASKFSEAAKFVVTAVNPQTGAVAMESFIDGDYTDWDSTIKNDETALNEYVRFLVIRQYPVVISQTTHDSFTGSVDYQVVININPESINCDCGKGIFCSMNTQQVNYFNGYVASKQLQETK